MLNWIKVKNKDKRRINYMFCINNIFIFKERNRLKVKEQKGYVSKLDLE